MTEKKEKKENRMIKRMKEDVASSVKVEEGSIVVALRNLFNKMFPKR